VVLPFLPGPNRRLPFMDVSVMTLSNVQYTPEAKFSELSWKLLRKQGFTRHVIHHDHMHDITNRTNRGDQVQYTDGAGLPTPRGARVRSSQGIRIGLGGVRTEAVPPPGRNLAGGRRFGDTALEKDKSCRRIRKECSVIRHVSLPGIDLLWCGNDRYMDPGVIRVHFTAANMVDLEAWHWGVGHGIVGRAASFNDGTTGSGSRDGQGNGLPLVGWVARYGGRRPDEEPTAGDTEDLFRRIVQGGLHSGKVVLRQMQAEGRRVSSG
jgi:hypothetical protein